LLATFGASDVCHLGGGAFAVCRTCCPEEVDDAHPVRSSVDDQFENPFAVAGHELRVAVKSGVAQYPADGESAEDLLNNAETALGHAKQAGERILRHIPAMNTAASEQLSVTNKLRTIAAQESFILNYQPKVAIHDGSVDGVEALLRWPDHSISPAVFVPILESIGLIGRVGRWVIAQALADCEQWFLENAPDDFRVAVNVSPLQLMRRSFAGDVLAILERSGDSLANRLELEVTESMLMADPAKARSSLSQLRDAGITVAIDDFGTGHSSLRVLTLLPIDVLKIDRCFVRDLPFNRRNRMIVQTAITLAKSLGIKTVAEGVETPEQVRILEDLGCDVLQGYLLLRPAPAAEVMEWLAKRCDGQSRHIRQELSDSDLRTIPTVSGLGCT
jgi:EAL domain-containing protein (putative c-di-GMP-specific phosphodiesterase class I)